MLVVEGEQQKVFWQSGAGALVSLLKLVKTALGDTRELAQLHRSIKLHF